MSEGDQELRALMIRYQGGSLEAFQEIYAQLAQGIESRLISYYRQQFCRPRLDSLLFVLRVQVCLFRPCPVGGGPL